MTVAAVGAALVTVGAATGGGAMYGGGLGALLAGLTGMVIHSSRCSAERVMAHQAEMARASKAQRQTWAQRGYRAGEIDTLSRLGVPLTDAQILELRPGDRQQRRNGA